jgi:hypothetical protein
MKCAPYLISWSAAAPQADASLIANVPSVSEVIFVGRPNRPSAPRSAPKVKPPARRLPIYWPAAPSRFIWETRRAAG